LNGGMSFPSCNERWLYSSPLVTLSEDVGCH
jgi:hypothetical protein